MEVIATISFRHGSDKAQEIIKEITKVGSRLRLKRLMAELEKVTTRVTFTDNETIEILA